LGSIAPIVAVARGARIIEKHFILDKSIGGPDSSFSLDFSEFTTMVNNIRDAESSLGEVRYKSNTSNTTGRGVIGRSLFFVEDIKVGEEITEHNIRSIRPGFGLHPMYLKELIGKRVVTDVTIGTPVSWDLIQK
ncbi:MAG: N-acetylneuraminate synthase family protein, partial [Cyclobacteriaceae bacterium]|nr:N-acetylneuraminate synthase family protein [Cyclobacteriaceae bacterium]